MKRINFLAIAIVIIVASAFTITQVDSWKIASNYSVKFSGTKVTGIFSVLKGSITFNENDLKNAKMDMEIDVNSIKTGKDKMDEHAKNSSWFDAVKYPKITFKSSGFSKATTGYSVSGELNLHGIKKQVSIPFTFANKGKEGEFNGFIEINRKDYGINGNMFSFMVGDVFDIQIKVPVKE